MVEDYSVPRVNVTARNTRIIPFDFEYYEPRTLEEALEILSRFGEDARVLAGGTDLIIKMKTRVVEPKVLVNIKKLSNLRYIVEEGDYVRIGALTTLRDIETSQVIAQHIPALSDAVLNMGSLQIRNMATIGGNLCNASPAADTAPPLLVHNAKVKVASKRGSRTIPLEEFFVGPGKTVLEPDEILVEILVEKRGKGMSAFKKVSRVAVDLSIASSAVYLVVEDNVIREARIALGSVAPRPIRARLAEKTVIGLKVGSSELIESLGVLDAEISPITDVRSTANYRRIVVKTLTWDAINSAYDRLVKGR